jgi:3-hydroxy-9,10-secoandrosta-1,3,5(10)-triene-9,17-dione monooxygenase reductase component
MLSPAVKDAHEQVDPKALREALGTFTTGVVVVTSVGEGGAPVGLTINSFNSVSLDPPLVLWSLALKAPSLTAFRRHDHFGVNILAADQQDLCMTFAKPAENKFAGVKHEKGMGDVPLLDGATAHLECRTVARYPGGDHEIYVGHVLSLKSFDHEPLVFHRGTFRELLPLEN